jgi:hypothetical protein
VANTPIAPDADPRTGQYKQFAAGQKLLPLRPMGWKHLSRAVHVRRGVVEQNVLHGSPPPFLEAYENHRIKAALAHAS